MSFEKMIPSKISEYKIFDVNNGDELLKVANKMDFMHGFEYDPDFLYMWVRIVSAGEYYGPNKNGDYFPEEELVAYWETFKEAHPFMNHKNKNVEDAIGKILFVHWNNEMKCVEVFKAIDKKRAPEIVRGYIKGYLTDVSMGCKVPFTVCSVCGNKARKKTEFCDHVRFHRLQMLANGERVFEYNYKPRFHDSSTVLNGAERVAKAFYIIDKAPEGASAFRKVASTDGMSTHYIKLSDEEMLKVASEERHPLLQEEMEKVANLDSPMMKKIAEMEKELTGKLLNIVSTPDEKKLPKHKKMLEMIKFMTEKRMDDSALQAIAGTVKEVAKENGVPVQKAFATLIGVAELLGIEFFPNELHTILRELTDAKYNEELSTSDASDEAIMPSDFNNLYTKALEKEGPARFFSAEELVRFYNEQAHGAEFEPSFTEDFSPPTGMVRIIKRTLSPLMPMRSSLAEHLLPRLSVVVSGARGLMGNSDVRRDLNILANPNTLGDVLASNAYSIYEQNRPNIAMSRIFKVATETRDGLDKEAALSPPPPPSAEAVKKQGGIKRRKLALMAIPAAYAASSYQKNRREHGRFLSDGENFVADHPGIMAAGAIIGGKPLSRAVGNAAKKGKTSFEQVKSNFTKKADDYSFEGLVKIADDITSGNFNAFESMEVLANYMEQAEVTAEQASAVKMATLLSLNDMEKEATEIMEHYHIAHNEKGRFLKVAAEYVEKEMDKAAGEFINNMILSTLGDKSPLARTLPGRAADAFVFKKLNDLTTAKEEANKTSGTPKLDEVKSM